MNISIIIPTYNNYKILKICIDSILLTTNMDDKEIIVVANGCVDETKSYLTTLPIFVKTIWEDKPIGFVRAINSGLHKAVGEYIVLFNDDVTLLHYTWLEQLLAPFKDPRCGIAGAAKWWFTIDDQKWAQVAFWCSMFRRSLLNKVGYLDDIFNPGNGEDIDFCIKIQKLGLEVMGTPDNWKDDTEDKTPTYTRFPINHLGGTTFGKTHDNTTQLRKRAFDILRERYGK